MKNELLLQAERIKLARTLGVAEAKLDFLPQLPALELRELRNRISHTLFDQHQVLFQRLADAGKRLPLAVNALISEKVFGPMLSARIAGLLAPDRALEISGKLSPDFQAELCLTLDPRSAPDLLRLMPVSNVVGVGRVLMARKEFITMARFVDCLSDAAIKAVVKDTQDDEALLRIGFYVESGARLSHAISLIADERLVQMIQTSIDGASDLQQAGAALISTVDDSQKARLAEAAASLSRESLEKLVRTLVNEKAEGALLSALALMSDSARQKLQTALSS